MKWISGLVLVAAVFGLPNDIAKINRLKSEAQKSYLEGDYRHAIENYRILVDSFQVSEEEVLMNYANAAFLITKKDQSPTQGIEGPANAGSELSPEQADLYKKLAQNTYTGLAQAASSNLQSKAFNQLGVMAFQDTPTPRPGKETLIQAQSLFKSALKADQDNQQARFNYELVTKMLKDQENQEQQEQEQEQQQQQEQEQQQQGEQENSEKKDGDPEESDQQQSDEPQGQENPQERPLNASPDKMEELKISEEKARMILEAMKNSEVQYIQQNQKKVTRRPDGSKPDW